MKVYNCIVNYPFSQCKYNRYTYNTSTIILLLLLFIYLVLHRGKMKLDSVSSVCVEAYFRGFTVGMYGILPIHFTLVPFTICGGCCATLISNFLLSLSIHFISIIFSFYYIHNNGKASQ